MCQYVIIVFIAFAFVLIGINKPVEKEDTFIDDTRKESDLLLKVLSRNPKNIVIFGESGVGKSSVVNMIFGRKMAKTGDSAVGVTFQSSMYNILSLSIFDTIGLNEGSRGTMSHQEALRNLLKLCKRLFNLGGINLFIFVVKKSRLTASAPDNFDLFIRVFGEEKVPVILVITHAETEEVMGYWYSTNKQYFLKNDMKFIDAVSICGKSGENDPIEFQNFYRKRYETSRLQLLKSIEKHALINPWKASDVGFKEIVYRLARFFLGNFVQHWEVLETALEKSFGFSKNDAHNFANELAFMDN